MSGTGERGVGSLRAHSWILKDTTCNAILGYRIYISHQELLKLSFVHAALYICWVNSVLSWVSPSYYASFTGENGSTALARWLSWLECHPAHWKGCGFDSQSGHMPGLWVQSLGGVHTGGNGSMFLSHVNISLSLPFSLPSSLSKTNLGWGLKNNELTK